jgi:hypothetical protein
MLYFCCNFCQLCRFFSLYSSYIFFLSCAIFFYTSSIHLVNLYQKCSIYFPSIFYTYSKCPIFLMNNEAHVAPLNSQEWLSGKFYWCVIFIFPTGALVYIKCSIFHNMYFELYTSTSVYFQFLLLYTFNTLNIFWTRTGSDGKYPWPSFKIKTWPKFHYTGH